MRSLGRGQASLEYVLGMVILLLLFFLAAAETGPVQQGFVQMLTDVRTAFFRLVADARDEFRNEAM